MRCVHTGEDCRAQLNNDHAAVRASSGGCCGAGFHCVRQSGHSGRAQNVRGGHKIGHNRKVRIGRCRSSCWCERGDSNPHGFPRQILSLVRLPIPPLSQVSLNDQPELSGSNSGQHKSKAVLDLVYRVEDRFSAGRPGAARGYRLRGCAAPPELL